MMGRRSGRVPSVFDAWVTAKSFVRSSSSVGNFSTSSRPSSSKGKTRISAPLRWAASCQGTMFEWCSSSLMRILSPACKKRSLQA